MNLIISITVCNTCRWAGSVYYGDNRVFPAILRWFPLHKPLQMGASGSANEDRFELSSYENAHKTQVYSREILELSSAVFALRCRSWSVVAAGPRYGGDTGAGPSDGGGTGTGPTDASWCTKHSSLLQDFCKLFWHLLLFPHRTSLPVRAAVGWLLPWCGWCGSVTRLSPSLSPHR